MAPRSKNALPQDSQGNRVPTWTPKGGKAVDAVTAYTQATLGANVIILGADSTVEMNDTIEVPYLKGATIGIVDGETYTFGTAQNVGIM